MSRSETRALLLRTGADIIATQGYNNTGINAVLCAAGVPKGSFYYYFDSKDAFGLAVIDAAAEAHAADLDRLLGDPATPPLQRLRVYLETGADEVAAHDYCRGCLMGNLGQELAAQQPAFRERLERAFANWSECLARCLDEAIEDGQLDPEDDARQLAEFLLVGWEGAILRAKIARSRDPLDAFIRMFMTRVLDAR